MKVSKNKNTILDIARIANVSSATVSRVINNPEVVKAETRKKVQQVIKQLNYSPNALARGLIKRATKTIGIIMQDINNYYYPSVIKGAEDQFSEYDYGLFLCDTDGDIEKEIKHINLLIERRVDGLIMLGTRPVGMEGNKHILQVSKTVPLLTLNDALMGIDSYSVQNDETDGAYQAVEYLVSLGHERIAMINGNQDLTTYVYKQTGYEQAMIEHGLPIRPEYIIKVEPYELGGYQGVQQLLRLEERPTAIFSASDQLSLGVYKSIYENGFRIPDDFSVIGFGGTQMGKEMYPELATVNQYPYTLGRKAAEMMIRVLEGDSPKDKHMIVRCELEKRKSCGRVLDGGKHTSRE